jgi:SepF-like predicted cell division protein (DUF552 family)
MPRRFMLVPIALMTLVGGAGCAPDVCDTDDAHQGNYFIRSGGDKDDLDGVKCITGSLVVGDLEHRESDTGSGIQGEFELSVGVLNLDGLEDLEIVEGDVHIAGNLLLLDVSGLRNLTDVGRELRFERYPRGDLIIHQNPLLTDLDGLESLFLVGANFIISANDLLSDIDGMTSLERIGWEFKVIDNPRLDSGHVRDFAEDVSALGDLVEQNNG